MGDKHVRLPPTRRPKSDLARHRPGAAMAGPSTALGGRVSVSGHAAPVASAPGGPTFQGRWIPRKRGSIIAPWSAALSGTLGSTGTTWAGRLSRDPTRRVSRSRWWLLLIPAVVALLVIGGVLKHNGRRPLSLAANRSSASSAASPLSTASPSTASVTVTRVGHGLLSVPGDWRSSAAARTA
jgi:hypothetical protein